MKPIFLISLISFLGLTNITAQEDNYESIFGEETTVRFFYTYSYSGQITFAGAMPNFTNHNTIYNEHNEQEYVRIERKVIFDEDSGEYVNMYGEEDFMWLREDTSTGKVWMVEALFGDEQDEVLVMDMSLEVGDFFEFTPSYQYPGGSNETQELEVIDVYYENGRKHIVFDYAHDWDAFEFDIPEEHQTLVFIEGVGTSLGFPTSFGYISYLSCVYKDGDQVYESNLEDLADQCVMANLSTPEIDEELHFSMYPNPTKNQIFIELAGANQFLVELFDSNGKLVIKQKHTNQKPLNVSRLSAGIYLVKITDNTTGFVTTKKLVKE